MAASAPAPAEPLSSTASTKTHSTLVGRVKMFQRQNGFEETGIAKYALLDPAAEVNSLEQVFIITEYTTEAVASSGPSTASSGSTGETTAATEPTASTETSPDGGFG